MRCCAGDGGGPSGTALQGEVSNHRKLLRLRAVVVSVAEKAHVMRQVGAGKANVSEPLLKRRKRSGVIKTGVWSLPWEEPGGCLLTGQVVTGAKVARARFRRWHGTGEPVAPITAARWSGQSGPAGREREDRERRTLRAAEYRGGAQGRDGS